jgi:hypothetical protein
VKSSRAQRRALANELYTLRDLLPEPTEEALDAWEAAGSPKTPRWWIFGVPSTG